eukprot:Nitzschia sp. Nitz4//scaffold42_size132992//14458//16405//NITZ4_003380-RA/size132992-processed-gene-0.26-mRNA-1//-1//CDS//3329551661//348//frame0
MEDGNGSRHRTSVKSTLASNPTVTQFPPQQLQGGDYYDDENDQADEDRMYSAACSFGQFVLNPCLCMFQTGYTCYVRARQKCSSLAAVSSTPHSKTKRRCRMRRMEGADWFLIFGLAVSSIVFMNSKLPEAPVPEWKLRASFADDHSVRYPVSIESTAHLPLAIPSLTVPEGTDLGGWMFARQFFRPTLPLNSTFPDQAGLLFQGAFGQERIAPIDDAEAAELHWNVTHLVKSGRLGKHPYPDDIADVASECRPQSYAMTYRPTCNSFHEVNMAIDYKEKQGGLGYDQVFDSFLISHGFYRDVWVVHHVSRDIKSVWKTLRWKHPYTTMSLYTVLRDAVVMERLSASPRIIDEWGHCGTTVWVEAMPFELEPLIIPGEGLMKKEDLHDEMDVRPQNKFSVEEKLEIAIAMAESLADLHGFEDGLIIHDDVQLCQWLRNREGVIKLGDFNRAEIPDFNPSSGEYCKYNNGGGNGNYRAPEEFDAKNLNEKIDIFSFGNNIYGLLTGLWVFYENDDDKGIQKKLIAGETAFIDPRYRTRSFIEGKLVEVMEKCWPYDPNDRIDMFEIVRMLREIDREYKPLPENKK